MVRTHKTGWIVAVLCGAISANAWAKKVVVPPIIARSISSETALSMTTLIASELEFTGVFDTAQQLESRPSGWGSSCVGSSSCLGAIARKYGADAVVGGTASKRGSTYEIKLVYYDSGRIVRTETTKIATDALAVADGLASHTRVVVTGISPEEKEQAKRVEGFDGGGVGFLDEEEEDEALVIAPAPISRRIQTPSSEDRRSRDDFEDPDEYGERSLPPVVPISTAPIEDPDDIQFGSAADEIQVEDVQFGSAAAMIQVDEPAPPPRTTYRQPTVYEDPIDDSAPAYEDLDAPEPPPRPVRQSRAPRKDRSARQRNTRVRPQTRHNSNAGTLGLTGRVGYSNFQGLNFLTYGIEAAFQVQDNLAIVAGLEAYSVRRALPPEIVPEGQPAVQWNTILPFNAGLLYKPSHSDIRPYVGAGMQVIPGYVKSTGAVALGFRARGGVDFVLADNFGLNLNAAAGMWTGEHFGEVSEGLKATGLVPQISGGTVFLF